MPYRLQQLFSETLNYTFIVNLFYKNLQFFRPKVYPNILKWCSPSDPGKSTFNSLYLNGSKVVSQKLPITSFEYSYVTLLF